MLKQMTLFGLPFSGDVYHFNQLLSVILLMDGGLRFPRSLAGAKPTCRRLAIP